VTQYKEYGHDCQGSFSLVFSYLPDITVKKRRRDLIISARQKTQCSRIVTFARVSFLRHACHYGRADSLFNNFFIASFSALTST
jgi:hypothetical protein